MLERLPLPQAIKNKVRQVEGGIFSPAFTTGGTHQIGKNAQNQPEVVLSGGVHVAFDAEKAGEVFAGSGLSRMRAILDELVVTEGDRETLPKRYQDAYDEGQRVFVYHERRRLFSDEPDRIIVNLTTVPSAIEASREALEANQQQVTVQNTGVEDEQKIKSAQDSLQQQIQAEITRQLAPGIRSLTHDVEHHSLRHLASGVLVGSGIAAGVRILAGTFFSLPGLVIAGIGTAGATIISHTIGERMHEKRANEKTEQFLHEYGEEPILAISLEDH